ncbi:hypothetical protein R5R35_001030 [Gryllus longicercus]|uniref:Phospholipid scramblase n=1 Tax=Gryllus longicercus TaxID=2509291 RepID=A0AAN9VAM1_9ORTH
MAESSVTITTERGLEKLAEEKNIIIYQIFKTFADIFWCEYNYLIKNEKNEHLFNLVQNMSCCGIFSATRHFEMSDLYENDVMYVKIPWSFSYTTMELSTSRGEMLGHIRLQWDWCRLHIRLEDSSGHVLQIKGPKLCSANCGDIKYKILSGDGAMLIGTMKMVVCCPAITVDDVMERFVINVPVDLDVPMKALIIGAALLIVS